MITSVKGDRLVVLALSLLACTRAPELSAEERAAGAAALTAWREAGLPDPTLDRCRIELFKVRMPSRDAFIMNCGTAPELAWACLNWDGSWHFFRPSKWPVVVASPALPYGPAVVVHELMHAMTECSGIGRPSDPGDSRHSDPRVWEAAGGATSVQARAAALLSAP